MDDSLPLEQAIRLRDVQIEDIEFFFQFQTDPESGYMAAFGASDPANQEAFFAQWKRIIADNVNAKQTICYNDRVVGNLLCYEYEGHQELGYWLDRAYWGRGIASLALRHFLAQIKQRPLYARCVVDNLGSRRVLEKNGFSYSGEEWAFSPVRNAEVLEQIFILNEAHRP